MNLYVMIYELNNMNYELFPKVCGYTSHKKHRNYLFAMLILLKITIVSKEKGNFASLMKH